MKRKKGSKSLRFIKSLEDIERISGKRVTRSAGKRTIFHSSGKGGGLWVYDWFIKRYFGSKTPVQVEFSRYCPCYTFELDSPLHRRELWKYDEHQLYGEDDHQLYGEWLSSSRVHAYYLEDELFEI